MKQSKRLLRPLRSICSLGAAVLSSLGLAAAAQTPALTAPVRLTAPISNDARAVLAGSHPPRAIAANDLGALPATTAVNGITLVFNRTAAQEAAIQALLVAQKNPASPQYQQWLTPEGYGAQFGVSNADLNTVESWLTGQGFTGLSVSRSRDRITFSGTAAQVNIAFGTELHQYRATTTALNGTATTSAKPDYAPVSDLSLPAALQPVVLAVQHLATFRPRPHLRLNTTAQPAYTSSETQNHYLTPPDLATMYDVASTYSSGINGAGQTIAIAGQTYIQTSDVAHFQSAAGLPANLPTLFLVPNSGGSAIYTGDEAESDLDVEYSLGMARGANVILVYVGDSVNLGVFDAMTYAVTDDIAPIISISYGDCELDNAASDIASYNNTTTEAAVQGQTVITSAGDSGSTTCFGDTYLSLAQQETPSVDVIADLPNVTGIGGLQMQAGTFTTGNTQYFAAATGSDNISSLLSYVPETVWNEDATNELLSGGGGTSITIARPTWQTGVPGIPAGSYRLVPDIALQASTASPGYLYCTSDPTSFASTQTSSCTSGFRDSATGLLTVAGGTSFGAPSFAGMLAVLNQAKHITRQGNINPTLYSLASNSATYASAFHDITTGNNACDVSEASLCNLAFATDYTAGTGYDEASGLGSIDLGQLIAAWPNSTGSTLAATTTTITAATLTPAAGATDALTINVISTTAGTPTGSISISVDGGTPTTVALAAGVASYTFPGTTTGGSHVVTTTYSGDGTFAPSIGTITLTLAGTSVPGGSFSFTATNVTAPANSTGNSTITLTPASGYNGSVNFTISTTLPANTCYSVTPIVNSTTVPPIPQYTLTIGNGASVCATGAFRKGPASALTSSHIPSRTPWNAERTATVLAGLLAIGFASRRRSRRLPTLLAVALFTLAVSFGLSGCGGSSATAVPPATGTTTTGTYTLTLVGTDSVTASITSSTTFTLTL